jgi:acetolactate synthase-1/2/3 large subunit
VSAWVRTASRAAEVGADGAAAVQAARTSPGQIATLILPSDTCWDDGGVVAPALPVPVAPAIAPHVLEQVARVLRGGEPALVLLAHGALRETALADANRIAAATGARLLAQMSSTRIPRGRGRFPIERVPYPVDLALQVLSGLRHVILVGAKSPVAFFAYPGKPGRLIPPDAEVHVLARAEQDAAGALAALADALDAPGVPAPPRELLPVATGAVTAEAFARSLAALLPEQAIVVDESVTFGRALFRDTHAAAPHDWLQLTGGAIGDGLPLATGAAIAAPGRRVVSLEADGSAAYTLQALWTQARERLDVTTVIFANRKYAILLGELASVGANPGRTALDMLDLGDPALDWVRIAEGMGVAAARAETMERFNDLFAASCARSGPFVIELATP